MPAILLAKRSIASHWLPFFAATCAVACGPSQGTGDNGEHEEQTMASAATSGPTSSSTTTSDSGDTTAGQACSCAHPIENAAGECNYDALRAAATECSSNEPCGVVSISCPRPNPDLYSCGSEFVYDEEALACALTTLRDRTAAALAIDGTENYGIYSGQGKHLVRVFPDGTHNKSWCLGTDASTVQGHSAGTLASPAHFAGCLDLPTAAGQYECLFEGLQYDKDLATCDG